MSVREGCGAGGAREEWWLSGRLGGKRDRKLTSTRHFGNLGKLPFAPKNIYAGRIKALIT
jgi:hypothetical protein